MTLSFRVGGPSPFPNLLAASARGFSPFFFFSNPHHTRCQPPPSPNTVPPAPPLSTRSPRPRRVQPQLLRHPVHRPLELLAQRLRRLAHLLGDLPPRPVQRPLLRQVALLVVE